MVVAGPVYVCKSRTDTTERLVGRMAFQKLKERLMTAEVVEYSWVHFVLQCPPPECTQLAHLLVTSWPLLHQSRQGVV